MPTEDAELRGVSTRSRQGEETLLPAEEIGSFARRRSRLLSEHRGIASVAANEHGVRITLHSDVEEHRATEDIGRRIVLAGLGLRRFEPIRTSLEQRFLEITSRLEDAV